MNAVGFGSILVVTFQIPVRGCTVYLKYSRFCDERSIFQDFKVFKFFQKSGKMKTFQNREHGWKVFMISCYGDTQIINETLFNKKWKINKYSDEMTPIEKRNKL